MLSENVKVKSATTIYVKNTDIVIKCIYTHVVWDCICTHKKLIKLISSKEKSGWLENRNETFTMYLLHYIVSVEKIL